VENEQAWRVSLDTNKAGNFNLDLKNPHNADTGPGEVDQLLPEYEKLLVQIAETRSTLKAQLMEALTRRKRNLPPNESPSPRPSPVAHCH
jgi:type I restriction enzyme M protein